MEFVSCGIRRSLQSKKKNDLCRGNFFLLPASLRPHKTEEFCAGMTENCRKYANVIKIYLVEIITYLGRKQFYTHIFHEKRKYVFVVVGQTP